MSYFGLLHYTLILAPDSSILAWKIPWTEKPGRLCSPWGRKELDMTERLPFQFRVYSVCMNADRVIVRFSGRTCSMEFKLIQGPLSHQKMMETKEDNVKIHYSVVEKL